MNLLAILVVVSACTSPDPRDVVTRRDVAIEMAHELCSIETCQRFSAQNMREGFDACVARQIAVTCENKADGWCDAPAVDADHDLEVCYTTLDMVRADAQGRCLAAESQCTVE